MQQNDAKIKSVSKIHVIPIKFQFKTFSMLSSECLFEKVCMGEMVASVSGNQLFTIHPTFSHHLDIQKSDILSFIVLDEYDDPIHVAHSLDFYVEDVYHIISRLIIKKLDPETSIRLSLNAKNVLIYRNGIQDYPEQEFEFFEEDGDLQTKNCNDSLSEDIIESILSVVELSSDNTMLQSTQSQSENIVEKKLKNQEEEGNPDQLPHISEDLIFPVPARSVKSRRQQASNLADFAGATESLLPKAVRKTGQKKRGYCVSSPMVLETLKLHNTVFNTKLLNCV